MIKDNYLWPKNLADILNKHWVISAFTGAIINKKILRTVYCASDKGASLINDTLDYINGDSDFLKNRDHYTIDDAKKVLSMLDEIGRMFNLSRKIERKNEIQKAGKDYDA